MSNPVWPFPTGRLSKFPLGNPRRPKDLRRRFEPDAGSSQVFRLGTAAPVVYEMNSQRMVYREDDRATLLAFYDSTLAGGVLPFDWSDPWPRAGLMTFRFFEQPTDVDIVTDVDGNAAVGILYRMDFSLEWQPWWPPVAT